MNSIKCLNLSDNKIGTEAAEAFGRYLKHKNCILKELRLASSDIDDNEARTLVSALEGNRSLKVLDMSRNHIGSLESLNVVQPDFVTGGEAIAQMLIKNITLETLNLSWNLLRFDSAAAIGRALKHNSSLKSLNLRDNSFAEAGAAEIGASLIDNNTLTCLDLSNNSVTTRAAAVIAHGLSENSVLVKLNLSGNPFGREGVTALFKSCNQSPMNLPRLVQLKNCNTVNVGELFDFDEPSGTHVLDMKNPYVPSFCTPFPTPPYPCQFLDLSQAPLTCTVLFYNYPSNCSWWT